MSTDWEARYLSKDTPWDKGEPSPGLVDFLRAHPELPRGRVCVPGCGLAHDVEAWARAGFAATGYDLAPTAVCQASARLREAGMGSKEAVVLQGNFLTDAPDQPFDWVFEHTLFCAIEPDERDRYGAALLRWLKPRGDYLAVSYLLTEEGGPPYSTTREEQLARFSPSFDLLQEWVPRSYPNRTGLERMFWWRRK